LAATQTQPNEQVPIRTRARVVVNQPDGHGYKLRLEVPGWPGSEPGQFLMLGPGAEAGVPRHDPLLPRPMAIYRDASLASPSSARDDVSVPQIEVLYRVVGRGTTLLSETVAGQTISLVGPLGRGFLLETGSAPALLVGGGTGIASLYELAGALSRAGRAVTVLLGARGERDLIGRQDFEALDAELVCTTEDGSLGEKGLVTAPLKERLAVAPEGTSVYACGPTPMMRAAADLAEKRGVRCYVSLENPMACGFGVCLGCAAPRREGGFALVCRQGPVFDSREIAWEGLP
jgi:dihydroorotate dehydrogenase electron transfer subunit